MVHCGLECRAFLRGSILDVLPRMQGLGLKVSGLGFGTDYVLLTSHLVCRFRDPT